MPGLSTKRACSPPPSVLAVLASAQPAAASGTVADPQGRLSRPRQRLYAPQLRLRSSVHRMISATPCAQQRLWLSHAQHRGLSLQSHEVACRGRSHRTAPWLSGSAHIPPGLCPTGRCQTATLAHCRTRGQAVRVLLAQAAARSLRPCSCHSGPAQCVTQHRAAGRHRIAWQRRSSIPRQGQQRRRRRCMCHRLAALQGLWQVSVLGHMRRHLVGAACLAGLQTCWPDLISC